MDVSPEFMTIALGTIGSGGIAWGIAKATLHGKINYEDHRVICHDKSVELHSKIDANQEKIVDLLMDLQRTIGHIQGKIERNR